MMKNKNHSQPYPIDESAYQRIEVTTLAQETYNTPLERLED